MSDQAPVNETETKEMPLFEAICDLVEIKEENREKFQSLLGIYVAEQIGAFLHQSDNLLILGQAMDAAKSRAIGEFRDIKTRLDAVKPIFIHDERPGSIRATFTTKDIGGVVLEVKRGEEWKEFQEEEHIVIAYRTLAWNHFNGEVGSVGYITYR